MWGKNKTLVDGSEWKFSLYRFDDGMFDIVLNTKIDGFTDLSEKLAILEFFVVSELGELTLKNRVNAIDIEEVDPAPETAITLKEIRSHLA